MNVEQADVCGADIVVYIPVAGVTKAGSRFVLGARAVMITGKAWAAVWSDQRHLAGESLTAGTGAALCAGEVRFGARAEPSG